MRRRPYLQYIFFALIAIGFLSSLAANPGGWIIPLAVFGAVFYLWKFPPNRRHKKNPFSFWASDRSKRKTKKARYRVIDGSKADEEPPRYH